jgi:hypothetical protein
VTMSSWHSRALLANNSGKGGNWGTPPNPRQGRPLHSLHQPLGGRKLGTRPNPQQGSTAAAPLSHGSRSA